MNRATHYRRIAEELRYRSSWISDPETREQLQVAARDYEQTADEIEDQAEDAIG